MSSYTARTENKVSLYKNAMVHSGKTTLYYCVNLYNYNEYSFDSIGSQIDILYNLIGNIENIFGNGIKFSMFRYTDILSPKEYMDEIIRTIRLWDDNFTPSEQFRKNVKYTMRNHCLLAVNIDDKKSIDFNSASIKDIINDYKEAFIDSLANFKQQQVNTERIDSINQRILNVGQGVIKACPEETLLNYYVKRLFPSYNLVIPDRMLQQSKVLISYLQQDLKPYFNYFEMSNAGVELFGATTRKTYGTVIDIVEFPSEIVSENFALNHDNLVMNVQTLSKNEAKLKFNRARADIEFEEESAYTAGTRDQELELDEYKSNIETALAAISAGRTICETDIHILLLADSVEELNKKRFKFITDLKNLNILATFNADQAKTYVDSFIKLRPTKYPFTMDLRYPLSFRLSQGAAVGDGDSKFGSPIIGHAVSSAAATQ